MPQRNYLQRDESIDTANFISVLFYKTATATPTFSNHSDQSVAITSGKTLHWQKDSNSRNAHMMVSSF